MSSLKTLTKDELMKMTDCKTSQMVKKGAFIFEEGKHLDGVYCIKSGVCKLTKLSPNGKSQIVKFVKRGDIMGQRSLISNETANLSAVALDEMEICFIPGSEIMNAFRKNPNFSSEMVKDICHDLKLADNTIVNMAQKPVKERLALALLEFRESFGEDPDGFLKVQLSREDIASVVGTATESLIRMLSDFTKQGYIETSGKRIKIKNVQGLERLGEGL